MRILDVMIDSINVSGTYPEPVYMPFAGITTMDEVAGYPWPDPDEFDYSVVEEEIDANKGFAIVLATGIPDIITKIIAGSPTLVGGEDVTYSSEDMWAAPQVRAEKLELPECETGHKEIIRNFARSILFEEELIAPGKEGLWPVEFFNALILSGKKNRSVDIPVDRGEYEGLLESLRETSTEKKVEKTQRITDPRHLK